MRAYSVDLRLRVLAACDDGLETKEVAERFDVSPSWVRRLKQRRRETGEIAPRQQRHGPRLKLAGHEEELLKLIAEQPDATEEQLQARLSVKVSTSTIGRMTRRLGLTYKKRH